MVYFFFNDTATTEIYTLSLHDALPICLPFAGGMGQHPLLQARSSEAQVVIVCFATGVAAALSTLIKASSYTQLPKRDRKSTRLNSSHANISYAVFCLKKKSDYDILYIE